ncbi:aldolase catalytic domain-containing protein [Pygmaiobacter massiliensis]|uniref:aldolase catalytic domain-containing protein n=1 Tax=Pygmaiobacter massiliensis TaxID=1917873 RepID=UPI000C7D5446|nr:aldolase catalytic domain-containing protein [Pygmaiobacter massiliensis]
MKNVKLLDCTLRDGGYINDWEFGHDTLISVFERLVSTKVDAIEIGFLDERRAFDINRSIMPDTASAGKIYGGVDKGSAMVVGMIDYGTCGIEQIQPCNESYLDGIRVIFKKHLMHEALAFCKQIKDLGYQVFAQLVSVTSYNDKELLELIDLVNSVKPYAVSMVDTYGLMHQENLSHIFDILDHNLDPEICIGYHAHNNFQMGYANCIKMLHTDTERTILVDGTLYGMGKSAGNAPLELLGMYMNDNLGKQYDVGQMLEAIENNIMEIYRHIPWGYNLFYYVAASNHCHPSYVSYLMNKRTLSIKSINEILPHLQGESKLLYDKKLIEQLYLDYQKTECEDSQARSQLKAQLAGKTVLVLGPGKNLVQQANLIGDCLNNCDPVIISVNFMPKQFKPDYLFLTNSKRYAQLSTRLADPANKNMPLIATSNVTKAEGTFEYELNYSNLIDEKTEIPDNSLIMMLKVLMASGVTKILLAGFDGYTAREEEENYFNTNMEYSFAKEKAEYLNAYAKKFLAEHADQIEVTFVTRSHYQD